MGGSSQRFQLNPPMAHVGRSPNNDIVINHPAVSGRHLRLDIDSGKYIITDQNSTNGTMVNGHQIAPGSPQAINPGDTIRIGDLTGNSVSLIIEGDAESAVRTLALGKLDLTGQASVVVGRDPNSYLPLNHPMVSARHAMILKQNGGLAIRDLGSTNGTFVNGQRISQVPLNSGDVIQIGPFRLSYDAEGGGSLAQSMRMGHRIDCIKLGREVGKKKMILNNINLTVSPGEFISLVGGSGAGKSTLMKAMNGFEPANHGHLLMDAEPLYPRMDMYRTQMGYVPQDDIIHRTLPVKLALYYAAKLRLPDASRAEIDSRIQEALESVDMVEHQEKMVSVLSGGQRKRVSIAVELLARPSLFFLDEPTSGLDPGLEKKMMYDMARLADEGRTIVLVTHATANIEQCDQVAFLTYGKLSYYGPPNDALKFFGVRDFSDIYLKLSQEINPSSGKPAPQELQPYFQRAGGSMSAGVLWADHYRQSEYYRKYVIDRQKQLKGGRKAIAAAVPAQSRRAKDSAIRQMFILARRQFDLIRLDPRTLFILLLMLPLIGALFAGVAKGYDFKGEREDGLGPDERLTIAQIEAQITQEMENEGAEVGDSKKYIPIEDAQTLITMLGLALTQGGTFGAAYEIVKERAIFKRERAVNLSVVAYVLSKLAILAGFAFIQVVAFLLVLSLRVQLDLEGAIIEWGALELFITLYLAVIASIGFGLFISAIVPNTDVVLYAILVQLFIQIILGGALFPLPSGPASWATVSYWTTIGIGDTVDLPGLNDKAMVCSVKAEFNEESFETEEFIECSNEPVELKPGGEEETPNGDYSHDPDYVITVWIALSGQILLWVLLTIIVQARKTGVD
ncbi:FHA domain-containing protein [Chloroflexota bacterium]